MSKDRNIKKEFSEFEEVIIVGFANENNCDRLEKKKDSRGADTFWIYFGLITVEFCLFGDYDREIIVSWCNESKEENELNQGKINEPTKLKNYLKTLSNKLND